MRRLLWEFAPGQCTSTVLHPNEAAAKFRILGSAMSRKIYAAVIVV
jgi:hypothetical protein